MRAETLQDAILHYIASEQTAGSTGVSAGRIQVQVQRARSTVNRALAALVRAQRISVHGAGRAVTYRLGVSPAATQGSDISAWHPAGSTSDDWSPVGRELRDRLQLPLGMRRPVTYDRSFVDGYEPNVTHLLPRALAEALWQQGRAQGQLPAGTYARKVLEQLLIDLSWCSSRLEGNRKSWLDTRELFEKGQASAGDHDAVMLLNHKEAIEFMVDAVPVEGMTVAVVRNLQSLLMRDLLADSSELGVVRHKVVSIQDSVYLPSQVPGLLQEMLDRIVHRARQVHNPIEAAFFLWVQLAYLQPFVDGNKRTSRLSANMPLLLANCAPLSFLGVEQGDYALAMLGVYEQQNVTLAAELFESTYRRSIDKYQVVLQAMGAPDPLRLRFREELGEAVRAVVQSGQTAAQAMQQWQPPAQEAPALRAMVEAELAYLQPYNCARYRLPMARVQEWIERGRPQ